MKNPVIQDCLGRRNVQYPHQASDAIEGFHHAATAKSEIHTTTSIHRMKGCRTFFFFFLSLGVQLGVTHIFSRKLLKFSSVVDTTTSQSTSISICDTQKLSFSVGMKNTGIYHGMKGKTSSDTYLVRTIYHNFGIRYPSNTIPGKLLRAARSVEPL